jgi:GH24 family phage-related lysozyme (muramidase)
MLKILLELLGQVLSSRSDKKPEPAPAPKPEPVPQPAIQPEPQIEPKRKTTNQAGLDLIKSFEGLHLKSYLCPAKVWTIGWGSTGSDIGPNMTWTQEQAEARLRADLETFEKAIEAAISVPVTDNQFSAIVSLAYNVGINAVRKSTLLKLLNSKDYQGAADQFLRWNKAGGKELAGLTRRRNAERSLFLGP